MKRNKFSVARIICLALMMVLGLSFLPVSAQEVSKPIVLKASAMVPRDMPVMLGFEAWGKEIEKRTNGRVKFEFYWAGSLLKAEAALKGTGAGIADLCIDVPSYHPSDTPFATVCELGYLTDKIDAPTRALTDLYEQHPFFKKEFERHNVKVMFFVPFPPNIMGFREPVRRLEDLKGKKIRALGVLNEVISKLGGTPVAIPIFEVYEAASRKVIDGHTNVLDAMKGLKLYEVTPFFLDWKYGFFLAEYVCMNKDKWEMLPPDIRKAIEEVNKKGIDIYLDVYAKEERHYVEPLKEARCSFYTLPSDEVKRWKNLVIPDIWNKWIEKHKQIGPSKEFFNQYLELTQKYESISKYDNPFPR